MNKTLCAPGARRKRDWTRLACECPWVSSRGVGQQRPASGSAALNTTVTVQVLLKFFIFSTSNFLEEISRFPILLFSSISFHWSLRKAFLSLLAILWNSHSNGYIFSFLLCFWLLFFSQLFLRLPQTAILLFYITFSWVRSCSLSAVQCHGPLFIRHSVCQI